MLKMETNNSVSIRKEDVKDILDIASRLEGEEAIAQIIRFSDSTQMWDTCKKYYKVF